ncbi:hypothetical protein MXL54_08425 [Enterobacteriaceae bacterium G50]|nr:hypothetical protein [Enterobacteriaceae bacterium G50]
MKTITGIDAHRIAEKVINILQRELGLEVTPDSIYFDQGRGQIWIFELEYCQKVGRVAMELPADDYKVQLGAVELYQKVTGR